MNAMYEFYRSVFGALVSALSSMGDSLALALVSAIAGIALVFLYKFVSPQKRIAATKRKISGTIMESVLFRHDVATSLLAQGRAILLSMKYAGLAIPALFALAIPALLVLGQLYAHYGLTPVQPGDSLIVTAQLQNDADPGILRLEGRDISITDPVRIEALQQVSWRLHVEGDQPEITIFSDTASQSLPLLGVTTPASSAIEPLWSAWVLGAQAPSSELSSTLQSLSINYLDRTHVLFGIEWNWVILFLIISLIAGLVFSRVFKVEI
jgi:hypothetical protein